MKIKYLIATAIIISIQLLSGEVYPLSKKPFLNSLEISDAFIRGDYLIIVPDEDFAKIIKGENYVNDFLYFKKTQGFDVEIWDYSNIGTKENLRDSLSNYYQNHPYLEYILLVGDGSANSIYAIDPFYIDSYNEKQSDVTDHPFTYFEGNVDTEDGLNPNYFIGRWSVSSKSQLMTIQRKTMQYLIMENVSDTNYVNRALIVAGSYKMINDTEETFPFNWPITPVWTSIWLQSRLNQYGYSQIDTALFYIGNQHSSHLKISNTWDNGVGIINYRGWGNAQGWVKPSFFISDIERLRISFNLPVVFSFVCNTGDFGNDVEPVFGEQLIRAGSASNPKGAVAMIGPSDLDTDTRFNNVMCGALWDGLLEGRTPELAQALHAAKQAVAKEFKGINETGSGGTQNIPIFYHHVYGVLGDPSLPVWLKTPSNISAFNSEDPISDTLSLSEKFINIKLQDDYGNNLQDVVAAVLYDSTLIAKGLSTMDGYLDIDFRNLPEIAVDTEMELYLNKAQYYQRRIIVKLSDIVNNEFIKNSYQDQFTENIDLYSVKEIDYDWIELNPAKGGSGKNLHLTDDTIAKDIPIGFDFTYYGFTYSTINICSNGWAAFESSAIPYFWNFSIPFPMGPFAMLAVFMDDLDDNSKEPFTDNNYNNVFDIDIDNFITDCGTPENPITPCHDYSQDGNRDEREPFNVFNWHDVPNHRFIVQWDEVSNAEDDEKCDTANGCVKETFQLILYDPDYQDNYDQGNIVFQYKEIHDIDDGRIGKNGNLSTIGIESPDQNQGIQYLFRGKLIDGRDLGDHELDGTAIQFYASNEIDIREGVYLDLEEIIHPNNFNLLNIYPNPFNPIATIRYKLANLSHIQIHVYNIKGQLVDNLYIGYQSAGIHSLAWNASTHSSGVYFITLSSPDIHLSQKVLLLK